MKRKKRNSFVWSHLVRGVLIGGVDDVAAKRGHRELLMRHQWIAAEHHRLHTVEEWPEGPYKDATLRAIHSALATLAQDAGGVANFPGCEICLSRRRGGAAVVRFPAPSELAA